MRARAGRTVIPDLIRDPLCRGRHRLRSLAPGQAVQRDILGETRL